MIFLTAQPSGMYTIFDENFVSKSFRKLKTTFIIMLESGLTRSVKSEGVKKVNCEAQR